MSGLVENFIRRIEKLLDVRATIPAQGTNHVDDTWLNSDIYPGELSVRVDTGSLYTSNGVAVIDLNREDLILHGLNLKKDTLKLFPHATQLEKKTTTFFYSII